MSSEYLDAVDRMNMNGWKPDSLNVNIPDHPELRFPSPDGEWEVEISPTNGYDDGKLHEDRLEFFVNVYRYEVNDNGDRVEEIGHVYSSGFNDPQDAVDQAEAKIQEYS